MTNLPGPVWDRDFLLSATFLVWLQFFGWGVRRGYRVRDISLVQSCHSYSFAADQCLAQITFPSLSAAAKPGMPLSPLLTALPFALCHAHGTKNPPNKINPWHD